MATAKDIGDKKECSKAVYFGMSFGLDEASEEIPQEYLPYDQDFERKQQEEALKFMNKKDPSCNDGCSERSSSSAAVALLPPPEDETKW